MIRLVCTAVLCALISSGALSQKAAQQAHQHSSSSVVATNTVSVTLPPKPCRKGAFTDAMALINSSVRASRSLALTNAGTSSVAAAELDSILGIAIGQASAEFECVRGTLVMGYDKNFADTAKLAWNHAKVRNMAPLYVDQALQLAKSIELNGAPAVAKK
jgi:hypothetical protein